LPWILKNEFTDVISLEGISNPLMEKLERNCVNHHKFHVRDADEGPYFSELQGKRLTKLVEGILRKNPQSRILIHCYECTGRTPEALSILEDALKKPIKRGQATED
jgi:predicted protein tyrosine phosphatase